MGVDEKKRKKPTTAQRNERSRRRTYQQKAEHAQRTAETRERARTERAKATYKAKAEYEQQSSSAREQARSERARATHQETVSMRQEMLANQVEANEVNRANRNRADIERKKALQKLENQNKGTNATLATRTVKSGAMSIGGVIFRIFAVIVGMAILYTLVKNQGQGGSKFISATGSALTNITSGQPMFQPKAQ